MSQSDISLGPTVTGSSVVWRLCVNYNWLSVYELFRPTPPVERKRYCVAQSSQHCICQLRGAAPLVVVAAGEAFVFVVFLITSMLGDFEDVGNQQRWRTVSSKQPYLVLPDGCIDVVARGNRLFIVGPMTQARWVSLETNVPSGIRFRPASVRAWLKEDPRELVDSVIECAQIPALRQARTLADIATLARKTDSKQFDQVNLKMTWVASILHQSPTQSLSGLATTLGISERHLRRRFSEETGLSPKQFARIARLQRLAGLCQANRTRSLVSLAIEARYCDQSHMNREVKALCGLRPSQLHRILSDLSKTQVHSAPIM